MTPNVACSSKRAASAADGGGTETGIAGTGVAGVLDGAAPDAAGAVGVDTVGAAAITAVVDDVSAVGAAVAVTTVLADVATVGVEEASAGMVVDVGTFDLGIVKPGNVPLFLSMDGWLEAEVVASPPQALRPSVNSTLVYFHRDPLDMIGYRPLQERQRIDTAA